MELVWATVNEGERASIGQYVDEVSGLVIGQIRAIAQLVQCAIDMKTSRGDDSDSPIQSACHCLYSVQILWPCINRQFSEIGDSEIDTAVNYTEENIIPRLMAADELLSMFGSVSLEEWESNGVRIAACLNAVAHMLREIIDRWDSAAFKDNFGQKAA